MATLRAEFFRSRLSGRASSVMTALRWLAGAIFVVFGVAKFIRHDAEVAEFIRYGFPDPGLIVSLVGLLEVGGGLMLLVGVGTRLAALGLAVDMVGAILTAGVVEGGPIHLGLAPLLLVVMVVLLWAGPGTPSLDARIAGRPREP